MNATQSDARMKARALKEGKVKEKGEQDKKRCEDRNAAAIRLVSQNLAGKAMASLQSDGVAQLSQVTFEKLKAKHPEGERPALPESSESRLMRPRATYFLLILTFLKLLGRSRIIWREVHQVCELNI